MDKAQVQDILDDFIVKNESNFDRVSDENPILYNAVIDALDFLSSRFGTGVHTPKVVKEEVKVEENLPLKVGDYFINKALEPPIIFKIIEFTDNDSQIVFVDADYGDNSFRFGAGVFEMVNNISSGKWVKVEPKSVEDKVKVGDRFVVMPHSKNVLDTTPNLYEIKKITDNKVWIEFSQLGNVQNVDLKVSDFNNSIDEGEYIIVRKGDVFFDYDKMEEYNILSFDEFSVKYNKGYLETFDIPNLFFASLVASKKIIKIGSAKTTTPQIKEGIKVGDILQDKRDEESKFKVLSIEKNVVKTIKLWDGKEAPFSKKVLEKMVKDGDLIKVTEQTTQQNEEGFKIGDIFQDSADDQTNFKVLVIGDENVFVEKLWNGETIPILKNNFKKRIDKGSLIKITEKTQAEPQKETKTASVKKPKKVIESREIRELKETIEGLEAVKDFLDDGEKFELAELRKKLSDLEQKNS